MTRTHLADHFPTFHAGLYLLARQYLFFLAALMVWALIPVIFGWSTVTITSGSMKPGLRPGDVVVHSPVDKGELLRGHVVVADDPARPGTLVTHRVAWVRERGMLTTQGDANRLPDSTLMPVDNVQGVARLRVPWVGLPLVWLRQGRYAEAASILLLTLLAGQLLASGRPRLIQNSRAREVEPVRERTVAAPNWGSLGKETVLPH